MLQVFHVHPMPETDPRCRYLSSPLSWRMRAQEKGNAPLRQNNNNKKMKNSPHYSDSSSSCHCRYYFYD